MKLYHGSPVKNITEFHLDTPRFESVEGRGVYLTENYKLARGYAGAEGSVYICQFKNQAIFDATSKEEFYYLIQKVSKDINFDLNSLEFLSLTLEGMVSGQYQITNEQGQGLTWQIKNLLYNDEGFNEEPNGEEKIKKLEDTIEEYLSQHSVIKYQDKTLGLIYLAKDPSILKIMQEVEIGSHEDESLL